MSVPLRRGLPRVPGGEPWPPAGLAPERASLVAAAGTASVEEGAPGEGTVSGAEPLAAAAAVAHQPDDRIPLRRGLPRVAGGEPWPPAGFAPAWVLPVAALAPADGDRAEDAPSASSPEAPPAPRPTPRRLGRGARAGLALLALAAVIVAVVLTARWLLSLDGVAAFVEDNPGTYPLPEGAPVGIPGWLAWQHFFNVFLLVLIVRTGLMVRMQGRPEAYWAPRTDPSSRISLMSWTHQAVDVLWVVNGAAYIVLLFVTGQWMRIVPTSWDVFPNAVSTTLQYLALDWPTENGWVHYNALQQVFYFLTVFVAAPLAIATGVRMSVYWRVGGAWDRVFPLRVARAVHFPVMIYFVAFVVGHVGLVLATGALRNLNHMYAGRDEVSWVGAGVFALSLVVIVAAAAALRPLLLAPVARRFGQVTSR